MLSLDEAIKHCEEKAKDLRQQSDFIQDQEEFDDCCECAREHDQLASWLKELAEYQKLFESPKEANELLDQIGGL